MAYTLKYANLLRDALHNVDLESSGATNAYAQGIVVGAVSTVMAAGKSFDDAIKIVADNLPETIFWIAIPEVWEDDIRAHLGYGPGLAK